MEKAVAVNLPPQSAVSEAPEVLSNMYTARSAATAEGLQKFCDVKKFNIQAIAKKLRQSFFSKVL
jgi:hypothetical protein